MTILLLILLLQLPILLLILVILLLLIIITIFFTDIYCNDNNHTLTQNISRDYKSNQTGSGFTYGKNIMSKIYASRH